MKQRLIVGLALIVISITVPTITYAKPPQTPLRPVLASWTGCYLGVDAGGAWGQSDGYNANPGTTIAANGFLVAPGPLTGAFNLNGIIGGVYAGCNYQLGHIVVGIEGDDSFTNNEGKAFRQATVRQGPGDILHSEWDMQQRWLATMRGRIGYVEGKWMLYVTGCGAWSRIDSTHTNSVDASIATSFAEQHDIRTGWTVGAGFERALENGWFIRAEYLFVDFPSWTTFTKVPVTQYAFTNLSVNLHDNIFRIGIDYKFDGMSWPVAAVQ